MAKRPKDKTGKKISVSKMGALIVAWAATLSLLAAVVIWLQLSYEPAPVAEETDTSAAEATDVELASGGVDSTSGEETTASSTSAPSASPESSLPSSRQTAAALTALTEDGPYGLIPARAPDGREPWQTHAASFVADPDTPLISLVIVGLGLNRNVTQAAIDTLPAEVTLAFSPYGRDLENWVRQARNAGHEVMLMLPTEPLDYPANDPGPHTLLTSLPVADNLDRLYYVMSRFQGYVGLVNDMGSKYTASADAIRPLMEELRNRGLLFLDSRTTRYTVAAQIARTVGTTRAINNRYIDNQAIASEIDQHLIDLQTNAEGLGVAVGIGRPYPVTFERIAAFAERLQGGNARLAPITAIANKQAIQ